jgi:hypothetical protein
MIEADSFNENKYIIFNRISLSQSHAAIFGWQSF